MGELLQELQLLQTPGSALLQGNNSIKFYN